MGASGKPGLDWRPKGGWWLQGYCCGRGRARGVSRWGKRRQQDWAPPRWMDRSAKGKTPLTRSGVHQSSGTNDTTVLIVLVLAWP